MKYGIFSAFAGATSLCASLAFATTYTFTFDDVSGAPNQAKDTFNTARYWENRGVNRKGTVWETPYTFSTTYPSQVAFSHFHIGFKGQDDCYINGQMGHFTNNACVPLPISTNRGPFYGMGPTQALYFQLIADNGSMVPFVVQNIDVYNSASQSITLYVRKTDGGWFYWSPLHGNGNGTPSYYRWILSSGYSGKFQALAWMPVSGATYVGQVGRIQITD